MCGRFALSLAAAQLSHILGAALPKEYQPRWNIAPDSPILILRGTLLAREATLVRWGFLGPWMTDAADPGRQINARLETAFAKPMFKSAFREGRCLVPADGFFEWQKRPKDRSWPFFVRRTDRLPLLMAGLWRRNRLVDGTLLDTVAILTRPAQLELAAIHHRMPVVVPERYVDAWLSPTPLAAEFVEELLKGPHNAPPLETFAVGRWVNDPRNDGPELVEPAALAVAGSPSLF